MKRVLWLGLVFALTAGLPELRTPGSSALVAAPECLTPGDYGQIGTAEDLDNPTSDDARGTIAEVWVSGGAACQRISSIYVKSPSWNGSFEFGWVLGYSGCNGQTYSAPRLFWWATQATSAVTSCGVWANSNLPEQSQSDIFRVSDTNANTFWGSYFNGVSLQPNGVDMDFARGWSTAAMERGSATDGGFAQWDSLREYHDANGWTNWDDANQWVDHDPDYHFARLAANSAASKMD